MLPGKFIRATADITGLINDTYVVTYRDKQDTRFILQRINIRVFTKPREVMANIETILNYQAEKIRSDTEHPDPERGVLQLIMTRSGKSFHIDTLKIQRSLIPSKPNRRLLKRRSPLAGSAGICLIWMFQKFTIPSLISITSPCGTGS